MTCRNRCCLGWLWCWDVVSREQCSVQCAVCSVYTLLTTLPPCQVRDVDLQCEQLVHLCSSLAGSRRAASTRQSLRSLAATLETVEQEVVPGVLALYLQPKDPGTRVAARILRSLYH